MGNIIICVRNETVCSPDAHGLGKPDNKIGSDMRTSFSDALVPYTSYTVRAGHDVPIIGNKWVYGRTK